MFIYLPIVSKINTEQTVGQDSKATQHILISLFPKKFFSFLGYLILANTVLVVPYKDLGPHSRNFLGKSW